MNLLLARKFLSANFHLQHRCCPFINLLQDYKYNNKPMAGLLKKRSYTAIALQVLAKM
jgi:hypothetical protein